MMMTNEKMTTAPYFDEQEQELSEELRALDTEVRWRAVQERDARFNGVFVYAVRSTKVYCKPSCPARRPHRQQVHFFAAPDAAEQAGFRACRRCAPQQTATTDPQVELVLRACRLLEAGVVAGDGERLSLQALGEQLQISPHHLQRTFKSVTGISPRQYAAAQRFRQFKAQVQAGEDITGALYAAGYSSSSRFYEKASAKLGMTPTRYRRGGEGMHIRYTLVDCHLGRLLVAASERGICAVSFGDDDKALQAALAEEYPAATLQPATGQPASGQRAAAALNAHIKTLLAHLDGSEPHLDLPLDVQATAFQARVWEELRRIPYGETRSYAELAVALGKPQASRAIARACATNPVALVNPCHRVIGSNGKLSGYRWGIERKARLLATERQKGKR